MRRSHASTSERRQRHPASATTAEGIAAERTARADRDRARRVSLVRAAARRVDERALSR